MFSNAAHKPLNRRQKKALQNISDTDSCTAEDIRIKMGVKPYVFDRWMQDPDFCAALDRRLNIAQRVSVIALARALPDAVSRLNNLLDTESPETARKSCTDILKLSAQHTKAKQTEKKEKPAPRNPAPYPPAHPRQPPLVRPPLPQPDHPRPRPLPRPLPSSGAG